METDRKFNTLTLDTIAQHSDPFAIKNFILSENVRTPLFFSFDEPFVIDGIVFGLCIKGYGKLKINFKEYEIVPNCVLVLLPGQIIKLLEKSEDFLIEILFVSVDFIVNFPLPHDFDIIMKVGEWPCMKVSDDSMEDLVEYHAMIVKQYNQHEQPFREEIVKGLLFAMLMELIGIYKILQKEDHRLVMTWQDELVNRFLKLLVGNFKKERTVAFYADKLCLSSKYLSTTVKKVTGQSILSWIHEAILIEAKLLLRTTSMTVLQISDELNFPNPSFFGRFFKDHTGMTPLEYRSQ